MIYQYFVEGECEKALIEALKKPPGCYLVSGKVQVFNFANKIFTDNRILFLKPNTTVVLVYDIDRVNLDILKRNIKKLKDAKVQKIIHIQSIENFEDELVRATSLKNINDMYKTKSAEEFKRKFLNQNDLITKLKNIKFDIKAIWSKVNDKAPLSEFSNKDDLESIKNDDKTL